MSFFDDYVEGVAMRRNPQLLQQKLAEQEASKMAQFADSLYGQRGQAQQTEPFQQDMFPGEEPVQGLSNITQEATPATRMYDESVPLQYRMMDFNKGMMKSGISGLAKQWANNQANMQNSNMSNIGGMARQIQQQRYDTKNPTATSAMKNLQARGLVPGTPAYQQAMTKHMEKSGVTVNTGDKGIEPHWMSDEDKLAQGIPRDTPIWVNSKADPKVVAAPDVGRKKATAALSQLEYSTETLNTVLKDYDPNSYAEILTSLVPLPTAAANKIRNQIERTVASAKKGWKELVLRDATGAVINKSEYDDYDDIFMPQPGESQEELEIKARLRHTKENMFRRMVGQPTHPYVSPYGKKQEKGKAPPGLSKEQWEAGRAKGEW